ncbi:hypothetical protein HOL21_04430 [Candidatus Woesearchaeota archaeon]|jgi:hypothetical protein|nr:hypothetical protein [Candidatus Woesearchaeota archaeon]MBT5397434.1 hypothetical protein [Candidatus Woesearchaeota archaeon]MBT5924954.1 hypothetical protein [Candidatus Woesearchaeota archaeon]MBT6367068.1 hypothetical protein [Candidatus Woesearchaeota archaeon]MBT7762834.1 hypothetical protein [Candidatus Woesearchaeota archaeon]
MVCSKRGMAIGQVFIFIVAAITFALIMIFGYKAVTDFLDTGERVEFVQFKTDLEQSIKRIYTEYGAIRIDTFHTPLQYTQICFVNMEYDEDDLNSEMARLCTKDPIACDAWEGYTNTVFDDVEANVFLTPLSSEKIKVSRIEIFDRQNTDDEDDDELVGFHCVPINGGSFELKYMGRGDKTRILVN